MLVSMALSLLNVTSGLIVQFSAQAPDGVTIGLLGLRGAGVSEVLRAASGQAVTVDYALDALDALERIGELERLEARRREGATILLASHDEALLRDLADEVWWIDEGRLRRKGDPLEVLSAFRRHVAASLRTEPRPLHPSLRRGDGRATLEAIETAPRWAAGEPASIAVTVRFHAPVEDPVVGVMIRTRVGFEVYGTNTGLERLKLGPCAAGDLRQVRFAFRCDLCPQEYTVTAASHDPDGVWHDWMEDAVAVLVTGDRYTAGVANLRAEVTVISPTRE
ncbi:MAG TPA: hypothetical protein DEH78_21310 [Solibacterales bacterium]|nr:hypothetical protein [Bryobacterales bacterium]